MFVHKGLQHFGSIILPVLGLRPRRVNSSFLSIKICFFHIHVFSFIPWNRNSLPTKYIVSLKWWNCTLEWWNCTTWVMKLLHFSDKICSLKWNDIPGKKGTPFIQRENTFVYPIVSLFPPLSPDTFPILHDGAYRPGNDRSHPPVRHYSKSAFHAGSNRARPIRPPTPMFPLYQSTSTECEARTARPWQGSMSHSATW